MYIALGLMISGMLLGRLCHSFLNNAALSRAVFAGILALLFLLGMEMGMNERLINNLPVFGGYALILTGAALAGSLFCAQLLRAWLIKRGYVK